MIKCAWFNLPEKFDRRYPNPEVFRKSLQIEAGFYDEYYLSDGTRLIESKSIAFEAMEESEFRELYNKVMELLILKFFPANTPEELDQEITNFL